MLTDLPGSMLIMADEPGPDMAKPGADPGRTRPQPGQAAPARGRGRVELLAEWMSSYRAAAEPDLERGSEADDPLLGFG